MTATASKVIIACWCIFLVVWLVAAVRTKRIAEKQSLLSALAHRIPVGLGWWLLIIPHLHGPLTRQIFPRTAFSEISGAALCIFGLWFTIWARRILAGNWSSDVTFKQGHELIRTGPYRIVRHPIYTGLLLMILGTAIHIDQMRGPVGLALVAVGFWIKLNQEERLLMSHFPDTYPVYRREVKALVPFVI